MNKECEKCIFYVKELDIDSSYYMCDNGNYKSSWPEFEGKCPYLKLNPDKIKKRRQKDGK